MSEPDQLYACVHISRPKLDTFLASVFPDPSSDPAVLDWLAKAQYYGPALTPEKIRENVVAGSTTVAAWVDDVTGPGAWGFTMPVTNEYDDASQMWTLRVLDFSENYDDFIAAVAVFRALAKVKDLPGRDGMLIWGHLFGNGVHAALQIDSGSSRFLDEDAAQWLVAQGDESMEALKAEYASMDGPMDDA